MKNRFFLGLLIGLFVFCTSTSSFGAEGCFDAGEEYIVYIKQGVSLNFSLPDKYIKKDGVLVMPLLLTLEKNGKAVYSSQEVNMNAIVPNVNFSKGDYKISISIGDFVAIKKLTL